MISHRRSSPIAPDQSPQRRPAQARRGVVLGIASLLVVGMVAACSDSEDTSSSQDQTPPSLSITRIASVGAPAWEPGGACVEIGHDLEGSVAVSASLSDAELRAPGACGARSACGHLVFSVQSPDGFSESRASSSAGHTFSLAGASTGIQYDFSVALVDDDGVALLAAGAPVEATVSVTVAAPGDCGGQALQDAGTDAAVQDASLDAAADAGDAGADAGDASSDGSAGDAAPDASDSGASSDSGSDADAG